MKIQLTNQEKVLYTISSVVIILLIILIVTIFRRGGDNLDSDIYKELITAKDELIQAKEDVIASKQAENLALDKNLKSLEIRDSILTSHYLQNQKTYNQLYEKLKNIPDRISAIAVNDDSIRAAYSRN